MNEYISDLVKASRNITCGAVAWLTLYSADDERSSAYETELTEFPSVKNDRLDRFIGRQAFALSEEPREVVCSRHACDTGSYDTNICIIIPFP